MPSATEALKTRAPSMWTGTPRAWAPSQISRTALGGYTWPPAMLWVFSSSTRPVGALYGLTGLMSGRTSSQERMPSAVGMARTRQPENQATIDSS